MAAVKKLIERIEVGAGGSPTITFSSIPETYTHLLVVLSGRSSRTGDAFDVLELSFNSSTANRTSTRLYGSGSSAGTDSFTNGRIGLITAQNATANTFANVSIYIPNYRSSNSKSASIDVVSETNATASFQEIFTFLWSETGAITSLTLDLTNGNFVQYSAASLYGITRYNTATSPKATGGVIYYDDTNDKWVHTFYASGTFTPTENLSGVEYLVVAGGGGGGSSENVGEGGGGGAGGYRSSVTGESSGGGASAESTLSLTSGTGYTVTIGAGGAGSGSGQGASGGSSVFGEISTVGGGGGGSYNPNSAGGNGGSGGGGGAALSNLSGGSGTANQGYAGGLGEVGGDWTGAGGGGAGSAGLQSTSGGHGGQGVTSSITGSAIARAGGAGGGSYTTAGTGYAGGGNGGYRTNGNAGTSNFGGGGGGAGGNGSSGTRFTGGNGGSGIVIVRYSA